MPMALFWDAFSSARQLSVDWLERYGSELALVETFVDTSRYLGTCYPGFNSLKTEWLLTNELQIMGCDFLHHRFHFRSFVRFFKAAS